MVRDEELEKIKEKKLRELKMGAQSKSDPNIEGVVHLTADNFRAVINGDKPVLVDFWAEWCMPCRIMTPVMEAMAKKYTGKVVFGKVNVDENSDIAMEFNINAIPNFILFVKGKSAGQALGAVGEQGIENLLKKVL